MKVEIRSSEKVPYDNIQEYLESRSTYLTTDDLAAAVQ